MVFPAAYADPQLPLSDWQIISTDTDGSDGWSASWDSTDFDEGPYWVKLTVYDALGHSASDSVEVWLP